MAIFPQGKTRVRERCKGGESKVFEALARHLEDDYIVWHDIPLMGSGRQPDFVLLHPQHGLLILEVKDWKLSTLADANPMLVKLNTPDGLCAVEHPVAQARGYALDAVHLLQKNTSLQQADGFHEGQLCFSWGFGAVLSRINHQDVAADDNFTQVFEPARVMLADDLTDVVDSKSFQQRLSGMMKVRFGADLSSKQISTVRGLLYPELRMDYFAQLSLPGLDEPTQRLVVRDVVRVMDLNQEEIARGLGDGHRVIHGPAGSGKTMILIYRALLLQAATTPDKPILILCFNQSLASRIDELLRAKGVGPQVQVRTFHAWAAEMVRQYQLPALQREEYDRDIDRLPATACAGMALGLIPQGQYFSVLIDEAHDLQDEWLATAAKLVDPATESLLVLYDDAQSIYHVSRRKVSFTRLGINAQGRSRVLKVNYRNPTEVLALAMECTGEAWETPASTDESVPPLIRPESAGRRGALPVFLQTQNIERQAEQIAQYINEARAAGQSLSEIAILTRTKQLMNPLEQALQRAGIAYASQRDIDPKHMHWLAPEVKLLTLHSAKGLEFELVIVASLDQMPHLGLDLVDELRLLYVGITRATNQLVLATAGYSEISRRVQLAVQTVRKDYATE